MNGIIVGYGSIGQRHARILKKLTRRLSVVSKRDIPFPLTYPSLSSALEQENPDYVVIANETSKHYDSLAQLAKSGFKGIVLIEKPLFDRVKGTPNHLFKEAYVGYHLRHHPILQKIFEIIKNERTLFCQIYAGQYLPYWRPERDYKLSYSAQLNKGGGVLLDLSHELDYLHWFFEDWNSIAAKGGKYSSLRIDSTDMFSLMMEMEKCPMVQVHLNYLDRINRREITIITDKYSIKADLIQQTLQINEEKMDYQINRDDTYVLQHKTIMNGAKDNLCTLHEGLKVVKMIEAAEQSMKQRKWIYK
ncbi:Gfo/Idh/MocA family protein [Alteribacillus bidgolensis]|uniref:Predicted dehydrogenase n=1 Tax=Alteribacillus bidgolensis TaxID=930129 RepID=A0A1G8JHL4_9BACI|nr:Gfo/Idh/MocA family oxidoreductase [Alteribacillus bidgolensis]SDI30764.1 Predicted dehydrogenase [Alteribacillus bidgolensis]